MELRWILSSSWTNPIINQHLVNAHIICLQETNCTESPNITLKASKAIIISELNIKELLAEHLSVFASDDLYSTTHLTNTSLEVVAASVWCPFKITVIFKFHLIF